MIPKNPLQQQLNYKFRMTALTLNTVNQEAANMFKLGESYDIVISPSEV